MCRGMRSKETSNAAALMDAKVNQVRRIVVTGIAVTRDRLAA